MTTILTRHVPTLGLALADQHIADAQRHTDAFLATLGHEMRNPLSALSAALEVWSAAKYDPEQMEELRNIMLRQVRQLTHLSDDLLDSARIAQGKLELHQEPVGLGQLLESACEEIRPFVDRCGQSLSLRLPHQPLVLFGDPARLLQVFANLIQNAAKFTGRDGALHVSAESKSGMVVVRIRDNGRGISAQRLPAIFESTQTGGIHALANDGLGIGLRLVKSIVELHGGVVSARSAGVGFGTEFSVRLPLMVLIQPRCDAVEARRVCDLPAIFLEKAQTAS